MEGNVPLRPEATQGRPGVDGDRPVMTPRADQLPVTDTPFADPKFAGNGGTWPGFER